MGNSCTHSQSKLLWYKEPTSLARRKSQVFVKVVPKRGDFRDRTRKQLYTVLQSMPPHENLMILHNWVEETGQFRLSLERLEGTDLLAYIATGQPIKITAAKFILQQLLAGLHYLHSYGVVHCDLKPENIMLRWNSSIANREPSERFQLAIIDFDDSNVLCEEHGVCRGPGRATRATPLYLCPEVAKGGKHSISEDIWQVGAIFYRILSRRNVQAGLQCKDLANARLLRNRMEDWDVEYKAPVFRRHPDAKRICIWLLRLGANDRPKSCAEVLADEWIRNAKTDQYLRDYPPTEPRRYPCLMTLEEVQECEAKSARASTGLANSISQVSPTPPHEPQ